MPTHSFAAVRQALKTASPPITDIAAASPYCSLHRCAGELTFKEITIAGASAEVITNLFSFTGAFELVDLWGILTDVSNITQLDACYFDIWDGANSIPITADGLSCNGAGVNAIIVKDEVVTQPLALLDSDQVHYQENPTPLQRIFQGGLVQAENGAPCYLRFRADTDANTDVTILIGLAWVCRLPGNVGVVAV